MKAASVDLHMMDSDSDPGSVHVESDAGICKANLTLLTKFQSTPGMGSTP